LFSIQWVCMGYWILFSEGISVLYDMRGSVWCKKIEDVNKMISNGILTEDDLK
jgi:hypothetical protein